MKGKVALLLSLAAVLVLSTTGCTVFKEIGWAFTDLVGGTANNFTIGSRHQEVGRYRQAVEACHRSRITGTSTASGFVARANAQMTKLE